MKFVKVAETKDMPAGTAVLVEVGDRAIALFAVDGAYFAIDNTCPHRQAPLCEGLVEGKVLTCPYHFSRFDLVTGAVLEGPSTEGVEVYAVRVDQGNIAIGVEDAP